jgi:hypothetical protein
MNALPNKLALSQMASGHWSLQVSDTIGWADFPQFADQLIAALGARVVDNAEAADMRIWDITLRGCRLRLVYEDYPLNVAFESSSDEGDRVLEEIKKALESKSP